MTIEETPSHLFLRPGSEMAIVVPRSAVTGTAIGELLAEKAREARFGAKPLVQ